MSLQDGALSKISLNNLKTNKKCSQHVHRVLSAHSDVLKKHLYHPDHQRFGEMNCSSRTMCSFLIHDTRVFRDRFPCVLFETWRDCFLFVAYAARISSMILRSARCLCVIYIEIRVNTTPVTVNKLVWFTDHILYRHTNRILTPYQPHTYHIPTTYQPHTDQINLFTITKLVPKSCSLVTNW